MRVAVVLAIASMLFIAAAADASLEAASAQKYDKKTHKHEKEKEYKDKPDGYKPDGYKPDGYKPDGYKPDGYKPDNYKPDGYKPDDYKHEHKGNKYGKEYRPEGYGYEPEGYGYDGYRTNPYPKPYEHDTYSHEYESYGKYSEPNPYDGGYWGGMRGRQRINLQTVYYENLLNTTLIDGRQPPFPQPFGPGPCDPEDIVGTCAADFGVLCAWRHHEDQPSYGYGDYASAKYGPIFKSEPTVPVAVGKGYWTFNPISGPPFVNLVTFNGHQKGYKFGEISGFINFVGGASQCHPLLGPNTQVTFNGARVPVYIIFGKVKLPVDPAILLPLGGYPYLFDFSRQTTAKVMGDGKSEGYKTTTDDYKTTSEGTKYTVKGDTAYVLSKKDNTLCGLTLVARGPVVVTVRPENMMGENTVYTGTMEWPIVWTDLITTLPLLVSDTVNPRQMPAPRQLDAAIGLYLEKTLDRVASVCESNDDIPWITPGAFTLDVSPSS